VPGVLKVIRMLETPQNGSVLSVRASATEARRDCKAVASALAVSGWCRMRNSLNESSDEPMARPKTFAMQPASALRKKIVEAKAAGRH